MSAAAQVVISVERTSGGRESTRTFQYGKSPTQTLVDLQQAFAQIGKVVEVSELTSTVTGRCRYGLQSIKLRAAVLDGADGKSLVQIQAFGDDVWGGGARKGTDKLIAALETLQAS